jgi:ferritin-like protein
VNGTPASDEVRERLLKAWRGEIVAGGMYELIAARLPEREGEIMRRMAEAESSHRQRLEARMTELGITIPAVRSVKLSAWMRLQAKFAAVDRLLAAREAAEDEEVDDLYKRSTGDTQTDNLLREIRKDERSHSMAVDEIRGSSRANPEPDLGFTETQRRDLWRQRWTRLRVWDRRRRLRRDRRFEFRADRGHRRRFRVGAVNGYRRLPRRALRG